MNERGGAVASAA